MVKLLAACTFIPISMLTAHMKQIGLLTILLLVSYSYQGCQSRQKETAQTADSTAGTSTSETASTPAITGRLAELGVTPDSHWRGINLGDDFTKVSATEKGESFESDARHTGYTIELTNLESADILYYQTANKVSAINVDLFLNSRQSASALQSELSNYLTGRYGASKPTAGGTRWTGQKGESILLKDVSKGKDFGLTVKITPTEGATTASSK